MAVIGVMLICQKTFIEELTLHISSKFKKEPSLEAKIAKPRVAKVAKVSTVKAKAAPTVEPTIEEKKFKLPEIPKISNNLHFLVVKKKT